MSEYNFSKSTLERPLKTCKTCNVKYDNTPNNFYVYKTKDVHYLSTSCIECFRENSKERERLKCREKGTRCEQLKDYYYKNRENMHISF